jgi:farnesyltranstransferase
MKELWQSRRTLVERALQAELDRTDILDDKLRASMAYSLMAGGKRLRPILLMAAADAVGADGTKFITAACALEMIHTYSLIHDDLPAMDNDDYRRGKLTNHKAYDEGTAILAGDALLTLAFTVILRQQDVPAERLLRVVDEMSRAAGAEGMVGGQMLDLEAENRRISMEELRASTWARRGRSSARRCAAVPYLRALRSNSLPRSRHMRIISVWRSKSRTTSSMWSAPPRTLENQSAAMRRIISPPM